MTLRGFLQCGYALLVEAHMGVGADLMTAVGRADHSLFGDPAAPAPVDDPETIDNDAALAQLQQMMMGIG
jgi:hypothetical protein